MAFSELGFSEIIITVSVIAKVSESKNSIVPVYAHRVLSPGETIGQVIITLIELLLSDVRSKHGLVDVISHSHSIIAR